MTKEQPAAERPVNREKFPLGFRAKLLLAMMLVVVGISVTTLFITQRQVQARYELNLRNQFDQQITYFISLQESRLGNIKEQCLKLSGLVRLIARFKELGN